MKSIRLDSLFIMIYKMLYPTDNICNSGITSCIYENDLTANVGSRGGQPTFGFRV